MKKRKGSKMCSFLLAAALVVSMTGVTAFATEADAEATEDTITEEDIFVEETEIAEEQGDESVEDSLTEKETESEDEESVSDASEEDVIDFIEEAEPDDDAEAASVDDEDADAEEQAETGDEEEAGDIALLSADEDDVMPLDDENTVAKIGDTGYSDLQNAIDAAEAGATITLVATCTGNFTVDSSKDITIDLNGQKMNQTKAGSNTSSRNASVIRVEGTLTIEDDSGGGVITDGAGYYLSNNNNGGGIYVASGGNLTLNSGTITGNHTPTRGYGDGVYVDSGGIFTMNGGAITDNAEDPNHYEYGGGVATYGTFIMNDGEISNNKTGSEGGGVYVGGGTFTMNGGIIKGNSTTFSSSSSDQGAGVYVYNGTFNMNGGTITGNTTSGYAGGVYSSSGYFTMGENAVVYGNEAGLYAADLMVSSNSSRTTIIDASEMNIDSNPYNGWYDDSSGARYNDAEVPARASINSGGVPSYTSLVAAYAIEVSYDANGGNGEVEDSQWYKGIPSGDGYTYQSGVSFTAASGEGLTKEGTNFIGWSTTSDGDVEYKAGEIITLYEDTTLYAVWCTHNWTYTTEITGEGTDYEDVEIEFVCSTCGATWDDEVIFETEIDSDLEAQASFSWSDLISAEDMAELLEENAEGVTIDLDFSIKLDEIPDDQADIDEAAADIFDSNENITFVYMDIDITCTVTSAEGSEVSKLSITETVNPIEITVTIPDNLLNADGNKYAVIRAHQNEGESDETVEQLSVTMNGDTLTFSSDLFSTYAIAKGYSTDVLTASINNDEAVSKTYDGDTVELTVATDLESDEETDDVTYTYQWSKLNSDTGEYEDIEGADSDFLTIDGNVSDSDTYRCTVTAQYAATTLTTDADIEVSIEKADQDLSFEEDSVSKTDSDDPFTNALSGAVGTVTYSSSDESVAMVDEDGTVTIIGEGTATITATAAGDDNYNSAEASFTVTVTSEENPDEENPVTQTEPGPVVENPDDNNPDNENPDTQTEPGPVINNPSDGGTGGTGGTGTDGNGGTGTESTGTNGANTADTNAPILYMFLIVLAGAAIVTLSLRRYAVRR